MRYFNLDKNKDSFYLMNSLSRKYRNEKGKKYSKFILILNIRIRHETFSKIPKKRIKFVSVTKQLNEKLFNILVEFLLLFQYRFLIQFTVQRLQNKEMIQPSQSTFLFNVRTVNSDFNMLGNIKRKFN